MLQVGWQGDSLERECMMASGLHTRLASCNLTHPPLHPSPITGLQAALYFLYFLYFNTFPIFPYIVFKCPIIPIFLTSLKENKYFVGYFCTGGWSKGSSFLGPSKQPIISCPFHRWKWERRLALPYLSCPVTNRKYLFKV